MEFITNIFVGMLKNFAEFRIKNMRISRCLKIANYDLSYPGLYIVFSSEQSGSFSRSFEL